jgi:hypothetical protein
MASPESAGNKNKNDTDHTDDHCKRTHRPKIPVGVKIIEQGADGFGARGIKKY